jgi:hypothetical protein
MNTEIPINDYTNRDYSSLLASLLDVAALKLPEWTDRSENDLGRMFLELFAYVGDILLYYQDRIANEAFLSTAVERRSVIDLLSLIGYNLGTPAPASADLTLTIPNDAATPVRIEVGARFATQALPGKPAVEFIYLPVTGLPLEILRDGTGGDIIFEKLSVINASQVVNELLGTSTGEANQSFKLNNHPVILPRNPDSQENIRVEVDSGGGFQVWQKKGTLLYSHSNDSHFIVTVNESDEADIIFGDGNFGQIPPAGMAVRATYLIGGGEAGNVGPNTITKDKSNVSVKVINPQAASGGADRESIEHARLHAPRVYRSLGKAVTAADYAALAENVPGVARAVAVSPSWDYVDLYIVAAGGFVLNDELRARLLRYFEDRRMVTTLVSVRQPVFVNINLAIEIDVEPTFYLVDVQRRVEEALNDLFLIDKLKFGQTFYLSKVFEAIEDVSGVASALATFSGTYPAGEVVDPDAAAKGVIKLRSREFPHKGIITINASGGLS